jgi:hypothetical protein
VTGLRLSSTIGSDSGQPQGGPRIRLGGSLEGYHAGLAVDVADMAKGPHGAGVRANLGPLTPKHHVTPTITRDQQARPGNKNDNPTKSAKPSSPVQTRAAPPILNLVNAVTYGNGLFQRVVSHSWIDSVDCARASVSVADRGLRNVRRQDPAQPDLVHDDYVVETLAADRSNDALDVRVLPRRARGGPDGVDAHARDGGRDLGEGTVPVVYEIAAHTPWIEVVLSRRMPDAHGACPC